MVFLADLPASAVWQVTTFGKASHELPERCLSLFSYFLPHVYSPTQCWIKNWGDYHLLIDERL